MVPSDREVREESDRKGDEAEKWQVRSNLGDQGPQGWEGGRALNILPEGMRVGSLTRLAAGMGQLPKDMSARTYSEGSTGSY